MYTSVSIDKNMRSHGKTRLDFSGAIRQAQVLGAAFGLVGGIFSTTTGAVFTVASWFVANDGVRRWLSSAGTVMFLLTIPLIIFGAFCMDWVEKNRTQRGSKISTRFDVDDEDDD